MQTYKKIMVVSASAVAAMLVAACAFVLIALPQLMSDDVLEGTYFNTARPELPLKKAFDPLTLTVWDVSLDGEELSDGVTRRDGYYILALSKEIENSEHVLSYRTAYAPFNNRSVQTISRFTVDTKLPDVEFPGANNKLIAKDVAQPRTYWGVSEPGAEISVRAGSSENVKAETDSSGHFRISFLPKGQDVLLIDAKDLAGNTKTTEVSVGLDDTAPELRSVNFESGRSYFDPEFLPQLTVADTSELKSVKLFVNGRVADSSTNIKEASFVADEITRGRNTIEVLAYDGAGNSSRMFYTIDVYRTRIMIDLGKRELKLLEGQKIVKSYKISIGMEGFNTPRGTFKVIKKRKNPTWYNPKAEWSKDMPETIGPGPGNPLGTRALYLNAPNIRIHGTYKSGSIGTAASHGCIRMLIKDSEELYDLVPVGTPTVIS